MTMQIKHLEYLVALSREKHFAHAAAACHVTQPTLSAGIKQLEESLGILIVERGQRFRGFSPQGERVLGWARRILGDVDALHRVVNESDGELIVVFDADHVPVREFLQQTVGYFREDPRLFLCQTPHFFTNPDPLERNLVRDIELQEVKAAEGLRIANAAVDEDLE